MKNDQQQREIIFYDGDCGFCHRWVCFVLSVDTDGSLFQFAPRQSRHYEETVPDDGNLQDTIVVRTVDGQYHVRSTAVAHILTRLGGGWGMLGAILRLFPLFLRDTGYRFVSRIRKRIMPKPDGLCPIVPADLRARFLD